MTTWLDDLRTRLQLAQGAASLLLVMTESDAALDEARRLLVELLRVTPLTVADLDGSGSAVGPRRWAELTRSCEAEAYVLAAAPASPLGLRPMVTLYNAERELLTQLAGPVVLLVSRATEKAIRQQAPDFFTWAARSYELPGLAELGALAQKAGVAPASAAPPEPAEDPLRFLHLSDLHLRPQLVKRYDQDRVLRGLLDFLERDRASFPLDLVFVTGDLASAGKADEYALVVALLERLMEITGVPKERVFVVPGNHDVDRDVGRWLLRTLGKDEESVAFFEDAKSRAFHLKKLDAYAASLRALLGEGRALGLAVGEEAVELVEVRGARLAVASFNSAWFAQGDDDSGKLWLGEPSVNRAGQRVADLEAPFAVALMHHPFHELHEIERDNVERYVERSFDLVVRGHLHRDKTRAIATQRGGYVELAGPAAYQGSQWPNGCFLGEIRPKARSVRLRPYTYASGADGWVLDPKVFPDDEQEGYCHTFVGPEKRRRKGAVVRVLEQAAEAAVRAASPAQQRKIAEQLDLGSGVGLGPELVELASRMARSRSGESDFADTVLTPEALGQALGRAAVGDLAKQQRISREDPRLLEKALERVAPPLRHALREAQLERKVTVRVVVWALQTALGAVLDLPAVTVETTLSNEVHTEILIGPSEESAAQVAIIKVEHVSSAPRHPRKSSLKWFDAYATASGSTQGALVLYGSEPIAEGDPGMEHVTTPAGRDVLLLRL